MISHTLILMTADTLMAVDIDSDGRDEYVSLEGNISMTYQSRSETQRFDQYIRDYYNIDQYESLETSLLVLQCGADPVNAQYLCSLFSGAAAFGTIDVRYILPLLVAAQGWMEKTDEVHLSVLGVQYTVFTNEHRQLCCRVSADGGAEVRVLQPGQLGFLFRPDAGAFRQDTERLQKAVRQLEAEKLRTEEIIRKLQEQETAYKKRIAELEDDITALQKTAAEQAEKIRSFEWRTRNARRCVVTFDRNMTAETTDLIWGFSKTIAHIAALTALSYEYHIQLKLSNGDIIQSSTLVASVKAVSPSFGEDAGIRTIPIVAPQDGRIFYLVEANAEVKNGDAIAIIGDIADTRMDVMNWYREM